MNTKQHICETCEHNKEQHPDCQANRNLAWEWGHSVLEKCRYYVPENSATAKIASTSEHSLWITRKIQPGKTAYICPKCYAVADIRDANTEHEVFNFCPYCGMDMKVEGNDGRSETT